MEECVMARMGGRQVLVPTTEYLNAKVRVIEAIFAGKEVPPKVLKRLGFRPDGHHPNKPTKKRK